MPEKHLYGSVLLKAKDILDFIASASSAPDLKEISANVSISKPTVLKILQTLEYCDFVRSLGTTKRYYLGTVFLRYGDQVTQNFSVVKIAMPFLNKLRDLTTEAVNLGEVDNNKIVLLSRAKSTNSIRFDLELGGTMDMYCSAMGKAVLSNYSQEKLETYLSHTELKKKTANTISDRNKLRDNILDSGKAGYAIDNIENQDGVYCIGFPLVKDNQIFGAFSISAPSFRITEEKKKDWIEYGLETKAQIIKEI
ncbi:IclR family transcriptional regulator [Lactiplantibacillus pentosus]|uniref:IclR family transcriptional regulator n=1 Tax=Lactiplantibacillus pentosus TaxID=1589 RepID=A0AB37RH75_LACPE|nr:IclR family transcriptional regulator [Lactiplantibacillus pentosus]RMW42413.1 IclR family transcriptional regulator [Lactiplantibacillus pentosus]RMW48417.1 IclR family transcriptional regulator [Lactiplantibacillus pentosus]RMW52554.1 IclR family transcriptional regulator [Lactiplantibacillus pentosus]RMW55288.1 IclR family transcriptional regulator [Lactiplantibacillus pentosus]